jgi:multicomponent Na+:H+ antiporter subunit E
MHKIWKIISFAGFYLKELLISNLVVVYDAITPTHLSRPGIVAIPLDARNDMEILLLANLITMTPGTLSMDVSSDKKTLYIHAMFIKDAEALRREIKENLERRVLELCR